MTIKKTLKVLISAILSLAILASVTLMPIAAADTAAAVTSDNLVANGDFEGISQLPSQFETVSGYETKFDGYYSIQNTDIPDGFTGNNLKLAWDKNDFSTFTFFTVRVPVESGVMYTVSYNIYTPDTTGGVKYRFSYGTEKWGGATWGSYGTGRKDVTVMSMNGKVSQNITATSSELWLLFGFKDGRETVDGDAVVMLDNISVTPATDSVLNGSFENDLTDGWSTITFAGFSSVNAADEGITAIDGNKVLKLENVAAWNYRQQIIPVEANTDYEFTFWVYRAEDASNSVYKIGNSSSDTAYNPSGSQTYLNKAGGFATGQWVKIRRTFNTGSDTKVKITFCTQDTTAITYIDNVSVKPITNYIPNGSFEEDLTHWSKGLTGQSVVKAADEEIAALDGEKVLKMDINTGAQWANVYQTVTVDADTDYVFSMWVYQPDSSSKLILKTGNSSGDAALCPDSSEYQIWGKHKVYGEWVKISYSFNTGSDTTFKVYLVLSGGTTYADDIKLQKKVNITATAGEGGTVTGLPSTAVKGDTVTLTATANDGYWFDGWYNGDTKVSAAKSYSFTVEGDTALTAKFIPASYNGLVENGDFEVDCANGWSVGAASDFSVVDASAEVPAVAIEGDKILKTNATVAANWSHSIGQKIAIEANTDYVFSFWYYRVATDSTSNDVNSIAMQAGNSSSNYSGYFQRWFNDTNTYKRDKWVYVSIPFNSGDYTMFNLSIVAWNGTAYLDDVKLVKADDIGNLIQNGDMDNAGMAVNSGVTNNTEAFVYDAEAEGYTGTGALKITGDGDSSTWYNLTYTVKVKANTDYVFRFYAKNMTAGNKSIYKVLNASNVSFIDGDKWTNGDGAEGNGSDWGRNEWRFNSGENTSIKLQFVEREDAVSYIDDIYFGEAIDATVSSTNEELGGYYANKAYVGEDDEIVYTATTTEGGNFLGWRIGDSEELVEGKTYTYKSFDDVTITAVFEAKVGNLNEDSAINVSDLAALRDVLMEDQDFTKLGDMNDNGVIDAVDIVILKKQIATLGE